ncbi:MAG: hypothetical protein Phog2KO_15830 [Phototrophicaceae bacterium]
METAFIYEIIGYIASALVATSVLMTSILRLRVINLIGATIFVVYGVLIGAFPVALVNFIIVLINIYQLNKLFKLEDEFNLLDVDSESDYLKQFVVYHREEIEKFYPQFFENPLHTPEAQVIVFVLRNMLPVGLFIAKGSEGGRAVVKLDYVIPNYRDFKVGQYLYREKTDFFKQQGITQLISYSGNKTHQQYLERMGFERDFSTSDRKLYQLKL